MGDLTFDTAVKYSGHNYAEEECSSLPEHTRLLGISAYQAMIEAEKEGDVCIVEKSYVLTGTKLQDTSLFFCALQNLIDMERKVRLRSNYYLFESTASLRSFLIIFTSNSMLAARREILEYGFVQGTKHVQRK